jgi:hypothetical protein
LAKEQLQVLRWLTNPNRYPQRTQPSLALRLAAIESEFKVLKAETQRDALREVQDAVNRVQGAFYDKLGSLSTKLAVMEHTQGHKSSSGPLISLPGAGDRANEVA